MIRFNARIITTWLVGISAVGLVACSQPNGLTDPDGELPPGATILIDRAAVASSGGTIEVEQPGGSLDGMKIEIPSGAYTGASQWTIAALPNSRPTLPPGMTQVGSTFLVRNGQAYSNQPFVFTIPVGSADPANSFAFMHDPASGTFELLPILGAIDGAIRVATRHVSASHLAIPANAGSSRAGLLSTSLSSTPGFGEIEIVVLEVDPLTLGGSVASSFMPGTHDWEFPNYGSWLAPGGFCTGSTLTALYHHYMHDAAPLNGRFVRPGALWFENNQGVRMASVVQHTMDWPAGDRMIATLIRSAQTSGISRARTQALALAATIRLTGLPQQVAIYQEGLEGGHAVIGYATNAGSFKIADPNRPGASETIQHSGDQWVPFLFASLASEAAKSYVDAFVIGATALVPLTSFASHWAAFHDSTAGDGAFPRYRLEYQDFADTVWATFTDTILTASDGLLVRAICEQCQPSGPDPAEFTVLRVYSEAGALLGNNFGLNWEDGITLTPNPGIESYGYRVEAWTNGDVQSQVQSYVNFTRVPIKKVDFELSANPEEADPGQVVTFTVNHGGMFRTGTKLSWDFGDGTPEQTTATAASLNHPYEVAGTYVTHIKLLRADNSVMARDSVVVVVGGVDAWRGQHMTREIATVADGLLPQLAAFRDAFTHEMNISRDAFFVRREMPGTGMEQVVFIMVQQGTGNTLTQVPASPGSHALEWVVAQVPAGTLLGGTAPINTSGTVTWQGLPLSYTFQASFSGESMLANLTAEHSSRDQHGNPYFRIRKWEVDARPFTATSTGP